MSFDLSFKNKGFGLFGRIFQFSPHFYSLDGTVPSFYQGFFIVSIWLKTFIYLPLLLNFLNTFPIANGQPGKISCANGSYFRYLRTNYRRL